MKVWHFLFLLITLLTNHFFLSAKTYFVDNKNSRSDNNNSGAMSSPWKTIEHAVSQVQAGDTIHVASGHYEGFTITTSGNSSSPIVLKGTHQDSVFNLGGFEFGKGVHHWIVSGFTVKEFNVWGIFIRGENHHIDLNHLTVQGGEAGIRMTWGEQGQPPYDGNVSNIRICDSKIGDCVYTAVDGSPGPCNNILLKNLEVSGAGGQNSDWGADGIAIERGDTIVVEDCFVHDNTGDGIDLNSRDFDGDAEGILIQRNIVSRNYYSGIKAWGGGNIVNNVVVDQGFVPILIGVFPGVCKILHNTVAFNMWNSDYAVRNYSFLASYPNDETHLSAEVQLTLLNNIFAFNSSDQMGGPTGLYLGEGVKLVEEGNNLYFSRDDGEIEAEFLNDEPWISREQIRNGEWTLKTNQGIGNLCLDPDFMSTYPDYDLNLAATSPAIDAGIAIDTLETDINGNPRLQGSSSDMGAIEFQISSTRVCEQSPGQFPQIYSIQNYPNPFNQNTILQFELDTRKPVEIQLFNLYGDLVYEWKQQEYEAGVHTLVYSGSDLNGHEIASGIYLFLLNLGGVKKSHKILLIR